MVSFVPPDGEFELMKYRCQDGIQSPFSVLPVIAEHGRSRVEVRAHGTKLSSARWEQGRPHVLPPMQQLRCTALAAAAARVALLRTALPSWRMAGRCHRHGHASTTALQLLKIAVLQITLRISSTFGAKLSALNTVVLIPVPEHTSSADIQARPESVHAYYRLASACRGSEEMCHVPRTVLWSLHVTSAPPADGSSNYDLSTA